MKPPMPVTLFVLFLAALSSVYAAGPVRIPDGAGLADPGTSVAPSATMQPSGLSTSAATPPAPAQMAMAPAAAVPTTPAAQPDMALGKRVSVGNTTYIGDFRFAQPSGLPSGQGRIEWTSGDSFEGCLENGVRVGKGIFVSKTGGFSYTGDWVADRQNGQGKTSFDDGDVYEGEMQDGQFHGQGTYLSKNGSRYEGSWQNDLREGQGKLTFPDGDHWEGLFSNDERTAQGTMTFTGKPAPVPDAETDSDLNTHGALTKQ